MQCMFFTALVAYKRLVVTFNKQATDSYIVGKIKLTAKAGTIKDQKAMRESVKGCII